MTKEKVYAILKETECPKDRLLAIRCVMTYMKGHANPNEVAEFVTQWLSEEN